MSYLNIKISETLIKPSCCTKVQQSNLWIEEELDYTKRWSQNNTLTFDLLYKILKYNT